MKVTLLLCDFAQAAEGKLNIIGGGWSVRGPGSPMSVAVRIEVPWTEANRRHTWRLVLRGADGEPVMVETPVGPHPLEIKQTFEVGRPPGLPEGTPLDLNLAINFGGVPLPFQQRFEFRLEIDDATQPDWHVSFLTAAPPSGEMPET